MKGHPVCIGCYREYGSPTVDTPIVRRMARLIVELYEEHGACTGGNLHVQLDDWNIDGDESPWDGWHSAEWIGKKYSDDVTDAQLLCEQAINKLAIAMTVAERASALGLAQEMWAPEEVEGTIRWTERTTAMVPDNLTVPGMCSKLRRL